VKLNKNIKITFIVPPASFLINEKANPPLGVAYLISYLKDKGFDNVLFYHIVGNARIPRINSDVFGFSFVTSQVNETKKLLKYYKKTNPKAIFICGGIHPTIRPEECIDMGFDYVVKGEGEISLVKLLDSIIKGKKLPRIIESPRIEDIDSLPFPDYKAIKAEEYKFIFDDKNFMSIITTRGCAYNCHFCASKVMWGKQVRYHSVKYIKKLIGKLIKEFDLKAIMFQDDTFPLKYDRFKEICYYLKKHRIAFRCLVRANLLTDNIVKILKNTGCIEAGVGIESFNNKMLKTMNKGTTKEMNIKAISICKKYRLPIKVFIMYGAPGETHETIKETLSELEKNPPNDLDVSILCPYPGTEFRENIDKYDLTLLNEKYDDAYIKGRIGEYESKIRTKNLTPKDLENYRWETFKKYSRLMKNV